MHLKGRCNCNSISYEFTGEPLMVGFCHCKTCQRQAGSSGSIFVCVDESSLTMNGETLKAYRTHADSGFDVDRYFCTSCGSPIVSRCHVLPGKIFIKAGTLDDLSLLTPTVELWCEESLHWMPPLVDTKRLPKGR